MLTIPCPGRPAIRPPAPMFWFWAALVTLALYPAAELHAQTAGDAMAATPENWAVHAQSTLLFQYHPGFGSSIPMGAQTLDPGRRGAETLDATLYLGVRLWRGAEIWLNPEADQGFGLQNTLGIAGFTSAEAYKIGAADPYYRMTRALFRQTIEFGGERQQVAPDQNVLGGSTTANRVVVTLGKFSVSDVFDTNKYAQDPRLDFMNWALVDGGAFDYAADSWGFTYGAAVEWYQDWWTLRAGLFDLSATPNSEHLTLRPGQQFEGILEAEERHTLFGQPGAARLMLYFNRGLMARLSDFTGAVAQTGIAPPLASLRHINTRPGFAISMEQGLTEDLGLFSRVSASDGHYETFDFTDIDQSVAIGLSMTGTRWGRDGDTLAGAFVVDQISRQRLDFFRAGGLGVLVGDGFGNPVNAGPEQIFETYYNMAATAWMNVTVDYQLVNHPAYNADRGPVHVFGFRLRLHI